MEDRDVIMEDRDGIMEGRDGSLKTGVEVVGQRWME